MRIFYSILERVGSQGNYQTITMIIISLIEMTTGSTLFANTFLFYQKPYQCQEANINCQAFVCSLPQEMRSQYIISPFPSLAEKFGDFRCNHQEIDKLQTFIYLGGIVGISFGIFVSQYLTNKKILMFTLVVSLFGVSLAVLANSLLMASIGLFLNLAANAISIQICPCFIIESVGQSIRCKYLMILTMMIGLGQCLNSLFFYIMSSWEQVLIIYIILPILIALLGFFFYIEEAPFDLITKYSSEDSLAILKKIAIRNGNQHKHYLTVEQIQNIKTEYQQNQRQKHNYVISFVDLFKYSSLRGMVILSFLLRLFISFQNSGPILALTNYSTNIFINNYSLGSAMIIATILNYLSSNHFQRKRIIYLTETFAFIVAILLVVFVPCNSGQRDCPNHLKIMQTVGLFLFKFSVSFGCNFFYLSQYEIFPNQIRGIALQIAAIFNHISFAAVPAIVSFCSKEDISIAVFFALSCLVIIILTTRLKETLNIPPPQIIEELQYVHNCPFLSTNAPNEEKR